MWKFPYISYQLCETHVLVHPYRIFKHAYLGKLHNRNIPKLYLLALLMCVYYQLWPKVLSPCSTDLGSFWYSWLREQVNHYDERSILSYRFTDLVWYEAGLQWRQTNSLVDSTNRLIFSVDPNTRMAKYQNWSGIFQDMPIGHFPPGYVISTGASLEPKRYLVINGFSEETSIELLIFLRPCADLGDTEKSKTWTLISRNSHSY